MLETGELYGRCYQYAFSKKWRSGSSRNVASLPSACDAALGRANFVAVNRHFKRTAHPPRASSRTRYMFSSAPGNGRPSKDLKSDGIEHHLRPIHVGGDASNDISLTMITNM